MSANLKLIYSEFNLNVANNCKSVVYVFDDYRLDAARRMLYRGERELALVPKAVETLLALVERRGEIVSKEELIAAIWADTIVEDSNLQHYLHVLRKTLGTRRDGTPFIETFRRRGYRFSADVQEIEQPSESKTGGASVSEKQPDAFYRPREIYHSDKPFDRKEAAQGAVFGGYFRMVLAAGVFAGVVVLTIFLYARFQAVNNVRVANARNEISVTNLTNGNPAFDATISRDGRYFVYSEIDEGIYHLWLQQTGQPTRIEIIPPAEHVIGTKTFSPNGEFVYFTSLEKGETAMTLYRVPTLGGAVSKILTNVGSPVSFSPDGKEMVFSRFSADTRESRLIIADSDGGSERVLLSRSGAEQLSIAIAWSPDGKTIAFGLLDPSASSGKGVCSMASVEVVTGAVKPLSAEKWDNCYRMIWTRDGAGIVFVGTRDGESLSTRRSQIYYLDAATGESRRVTSDGNLYQDLSLGVTDDNSIIAVSHNLYSQIWVMNADGDSHSAVQLTNGPADGRAGIAPLPDGCVGYVARTGENLSLWTMNPDGTNQRQIFNELPFIYSLRATPDGRYFIFAARRGEFTHLYRLNTDGTNLVQLTDGDSVETEATVSPDSRWIFYGSNVFDGAGWKSSLQKIPVDGGAAIRLTSDEAKSIVPHFSPDGKFISDIAADNKFVLRTAAGTTVKTFEAVKNAFFHNGVRWLPDGRGLTYTVYKNNLINIWQQPQNDEKPRALTDFTSGEIHNYAFSADGTKLYVSRGYQTRNAVLIKNFK
jgi:Tol biopolymer transport system component/DNA-binding winged helix-turn-helix (wHTH) protein